MRSVAQILVPKGVVVPVFEPLPTHNLRLRWRFDFAGKPTRKGCWDGSSNLESDMATRVNKTGLIRAAIEAESRLTQEESVIVECQGPDYAFFQWEAYGRAPNPFGKWGGNFVVRGTISGLTMFTRHEKITVYVNGRVERQPLTTDENRFSFEEHSV